jgi:hypothetical protein
MKDIEQPDFLQQHITLQHMFARKYATCATYAMQILSFVSTLCFQRQLKNATILCCTPAKYIRYAHGIQHCRQPALHICPALPLCLCHLAFLRGPRLTTIGEGEP